MQHMKQRFYAALTLCLTACSGGAEQIETQAPAVESGNQAQAEASEEEQQMVKSEPSARSASAAAGTLAKGEAAGTEAQSAAAQPTLTRVELRYLDASTPPEYHRSYTINVEAGKVNTTVDVYGDIIATDVTTVAASAWSKLGQTVPSAPPIGEDGEAVGGSSYSLKVWQGAEERDFTWSAHTPDGAALKSVAAFAARVEALVPKLQQLKDTAYGQSE